MAGIKEIRTRIRSVESTLKITNAMFLISSASLRKARQHLAEVSPYFTKFSDTISDVLHHSPNLDHPFFNQRPNLSAQEREIGYIVITGDKGLAGAYNHNVLKLAEQKLAATARPSLYMMGQMGRSWFNGKGIPIDQEFMYDAKNPTIYQAREITESLLPHFLAGELDEIWIIYTKMINPLNLEPRVVQLLPLRREIFPWQPRSEEAFPRTVTYYPSEHVVLDRLVPGYFTGTVFGAMVESFCSEQSARMTAMDASTKNARDMLKNLSLTYNRARQAAITQEITEVVGGAQPGRS